MCVVTLNLSDKQVDMLQRVALAEKFTSPPVSSKLTTAERFAVLDSLERLGLVSKAIGQPYRLTAAGRAELRARPWPYGDRVKP